MLLICFKVFGFSLFAISLFYILNITTKYVKNNCFFTPIEEVTEDYLYTHRHNFFKIRLKNGNLFVGKLLFTTTNTPNLLYQNSRTYITEYFFYCNTRYIKLCHIKELKFIENDI